jgi:hypothetical protein
MDRYPERLIAGYTRAMGIVQPAALRIEWTPLRTMWC